MILSLSGHGYWCLGRVQILSLARQSHSPRMLASPQYGDIEGAVWVLLAVLSNDIQCWKHLKPIGNLIDTHTHTKERQWSGFVNFCHPRCILSCWDKQKFKDWNLPNCRLHQSSYMSSGRFRYCLCLLVEVEAKLAETDWLILRGKS